MNELPKLIILYGGFGDVPDAKYQGLIDGKLNCGYREYAQRFGHIIYMRPQFVRTDWESAIPKVDDVIQFCRDRPDHIVWSVKYDETKEYVMSQIPNASCYYSCNNRNMYSHTVDVSLVDTEERVHCYKNARLFFKGKAAKFWRYENQPKLYDYALIGIRGDKNEQYFLEHLTKIVKDIRNVIWIGGKGKEIKSHHNIVYTYPSNKDDVYYGLSISRVGVLFTEHPTEGFPQSFIEMNMCGIPVVYNKHAPWNKYYGKQGVNVFKCKKNALIETAEDTLKLWSPTMAARCASYASMHFDLDSSYSLIVKELMENGC